jgi:hypothetical protein
VRTAVEPGENLGKMLGKPGRHWKKKLLTTGKKNRLHLYSPHWKKKLKTLEKVKIRICTLNVFTAEISYLYNMCKVRALKHAIA